MTKSQEKPRSATRPATSVNCYDYPQYWDIAFRSDTRDEADFIEAAARKYCPLPLADILEPGCGGGRLIVEMARRGYQITGIDLSETAVKYVRQRLKRRNLDATVSVGDMTTFCRPGGFDLAFNMVNTFRHLTSEAASRQHLQCIADSLRPGGIYILGLHLLPPDAEEYDSERWSARHASTRVNMHLRVMDFDRLRRLEVIRFTLNVHSGSRRLKLSTDYTLRIYTAQQMRQLLQSVPTLELVDVYDFCYDITEPLALNNDLGDTVLILQKRTE